MRYSIPAENMASLTKKMTRIQNKCRKYGCDFKFEIVGKEIREIDEVTSIECLIVEAEGVAIINNWQFVASLDHTDRGNIINKAVDIEVPEFYYTTAPICEHCKTKHMRKYTYIVRNTETGEFKQVGTSCLKDFTFGMSAEAVAKYEQAIKDLEESQTCGGSGYVEKRYQRQRFLQFVIETVNKFGYVKSGETDSTIGRVMDFIRAKYGIAHDRYDREYNQRKLEEMEKVGFNHETEENKEIAQKAVEWALSQEDNSNYMHNLKVVCALDYVGVGNLGILTSLIPVYYRAVERELRIAEKKAKEIAESHWQGEVGKRLTVEVVDWRIVTGWETQWGYTYIYKMADEAGNIYTWKTSKYINEKLETFVITGSVKAHTEFREVKQTELTRCKIERGA